MGLRQILLVATASAIVMTGCQSKPDSAPVETAAEQTLHERILTLDTHVDIPLNYMDEVDPGWETEAQVDLPKMVEGGLDAAFFIVYTPQAQVSVDGYKEAAKIAETRYRAIQQMLIKYPDRVELALTAADIRRIVGLTHFGHNQFGDSSNPKVQWGEGENLHGGLSQLGRELVVKLNDVGVMVDVSHAGKQTMMDAVKLSRVPIIASHSGAMGVTESPRNLDDEQLRALAGNGGVVQLVALGAYIKALSPEQEAFKADLRAVMGIKDDKAFYAMSEIQRDAYYEALKPMYALAPPASVSDLVDHIDYTVKLIGIDHVGIASDFDGGGGVVGWEDASKTPNVTAELERRGYSEADIAKIWGGNLLRVMEAVEAGAK